MDLELMNKQVVSKKRVADHGEVFTSEREVNAMLELVKQETERIDSRFLVPACGKGNFLTEILERKLYVVGARYRKSQLEYERNAFLAISSIYGVDILEDNVVECRNRLFELSDQKYSSFFKKKSKDEYRSTIQFILEKNIIWGDALTLKTVGDNPQPIVFSEWSPVNGSLFKRRDFAFHELFHKRKERQHSLFSKPSQVPDSDLGNEVFLSSPVKDYPLTHFMRFTDIE
jgi:hypothetical protein